MAADERLVRFVEEALRRGTPRAEIERELAAAGWRREEVAEGLAAFAESPFPVPVPRPRPYLSAKEAFLYLVLFTALYLSAWHLGSLLFELIEDAWPDPGAEGRHRLLDAEAIRWAIAWLAVAFPLFLLLSASLERAARLDPARRGSRVRKWLTYLTLYVAAAVLVGDLATVLFRLLGGELTARFLAKVATLAGLAAAVLVYYLGELRAEEGGGEEPARRRRRSPWAWGAAAAVVAACLAGAFHLKPPAEQRLLRLDTARVAALRQIAGQVEEHHRRHGSLPADLGTLAAEPWTGEIGRDPETGAPYELRLLGESRFALCADFARPSPPPRQPREDSFWNHPAGRHCFEVEATARPETR
ncbi:MAG TPA: DUF5671 domain-containing protein [Thermoanaerobaculia bacterium]|nr:DUF5671 domain-containing protein [Thermoanaerobaculia bacterium]